MRKGSDQGFAPGELVISWRFEPKGIFDDELNLQIDGQEVVFRSGVAESRSRFVSIEAARQTATILNDSIKLVLIASPENFATEVRLSGPRIDYVNPDGHEVKYLEAESAVSFSDACSVEVFAAGPDGNRMKVDCPNTSQRSHDAELLGRCCNDKCLRHMISCLSNAKRDSPNALVHLYEIREAIKELFGGEKAARQQLGFHKSDWNELGRIANDEPLNEGRHRGKSLTNLRDATPEELQYCFTFARSLVLEYARLVDSRT